eukprot:gene7620-15603_t
MNTETNEDPVFDDNIWSDINLQDYIENDGEDDEPHTFKNNLSYEELVDLFSFSTLSNESNNNNNNSLIKSKIIRIPRNILTENGIITVEDRMMTYYEQFQDDISASPYEKLKKLPFVTSCFRQLHDSNNHSVMPSLKLKLDALNSTYVEPKRNRDKDWILHSQRNILDTQPADKGILKLGKYDEEKLSPLEWLTPLQSLLRKKCLIRRSIMISETLCIVQIIGIGIAGRLISNNSNTKRMLVIEVYSVWNSQIYTLNVTMYKLKSLFINNSNLLEPGKKLQLLEELIHLLYFDYILILPPIPPERMINKEIEKEIRIIKTSHLEDPNIPEGYPNSIMEVIRVHQDGLPLEDLSIPQLHQILRISEMRRDTGAMKRRRDEADRIRREAEEEERRRKAWLAIPKRIRGREYVRCVRQHGKIAIIESYKFPTRPTICSTRAFITAESFQMTLSLVLTTIAKLFKVRKHPCLWTSEISKKVCTLIVKSIKLKGIHYPTVELYMTMMDRKGATATLKSLKSISEWGEGRIANARKMNFKTNETLLVNDFLSVSLSTSAMGRASTQIRRCGYLPCCIPRREIGRGKRVCSRVLSVNGTKGIFTMYCRNEVPIINKMNHAFKDRNKPLATATTQQQPQQQQQPESELDIPSNNNYNNTSITDNNNIDNNTNAIKISKQDSNDSSNTNTTDGYKALALEFQTSTAEYSKHELESLALHLVVEIDAYFPYKSNILGQDLLENTLLRVQFHRLDILRMITDENILINALNSMEKSFYYIATKDEISKAELAWSHILSTIVAEARWGFHIPIDISNIKNDIVKFSHEEKIKLSEKILHIDACVVGNELGGQVEPTFQMNDIRKEYHQHRQESLSLDEFDEIEKDMARESETDNKDSMKSLATATPQSSDSHSQSLILRWSAVVMRKVLKIPSVIKSRMSPTFQVAMWQKGLKLGVIGFDHERHDFQDFDIYAARPSAKTQRIFLEGLQALSFQERSVNIQLFLADLEYFEVLKDEKHVGSIRFVDNNNLRMNVVDDDYKVRTDVATNKAAEAARARTKATANTDVNSDLQAEAERKFLKSQGINSNNSIGAIEEDSLESFDDLGNDIDDNDG